MKAAIIGIALMLSAILALAEPLPVPKPPGPGGSCPHGYLRIARWQRNAILAVSRRMVCPYAAAASSALGCATNWSIIALAALNRSSVTASAATSLFAVAPAHPRRLVGIFVIGRVAAKPQAQLASAPIGSVKLGLSLGGVGKLINVP
jgi:hypothetical protein